MNFLGIKEKSKLSFWVGFLISLACILSNLSQLDFFVNSGRTQLLNYPGWILLLLLIPIYTKGCLKITKTPQYYYLLILIIIVATLLLSITGKKYIQSQVIESLLISTLVYSIGYFYGGAIGEKEINMILISYVISASVVAIFVFFGYFRNVNFETLQYEYSSKNSLSQIIFTSVIVLWGLSTKKIVTKVIKFLLLIFQAVLMLLLRSRAVLLSFAVCLVYIVCSKNISKKIKGAVFLAITFAIIFFIFNGDLFDKVLNYTVFIGRRSGTIDELSSGRLSILRTFPILIENHVFEGIGAYYFECFPLSCILQFGVIVGPLVIVAGYFPFIYCWKLPRGNVYIQIFVMICLGYIINSLFEGLAPIGPGVKCFFLWLLFGIFSNSNSLLIKGGKV